jgi:hypothetical protein
MNVKIYLYYIKNRIKNKEKKYFNGYSLQYLNFESFHKKYIKYILKYYIVLYIFVYFYIFL